MNVIQLSDHLTRLPGHDRPQALYRPPEHRARRGLKSALTPSAT